jgi:GMP synthase-like glutamine amidotransferase
MEEKKTRHRRSTEELLADLERKRQELLVKHREALAKIEEQKQRLAKSPATRKAAMENQKRFEHAARKLAPDWDHRHFIAVIQEAVEHGIDADAMAKKGEALLAEHGKGRRGRRPKNG